MAWGCLRLTSLSWMAAKEPVCNYCVAGRFLLSETVLFRQCMVRFYRALASCRFLVADGDVVLEIEEIAVADAEILAEA